MELFWRCSREISKKVEIPFEIFFDVEYSRCKVKVTTISDQFHARRQQSLLLVHSELVLFVLSEILCR